MERGGLGFHQRKPLERLGAQEEADGRGKREGPQLAWGAVGTGIPPHQALRWRRHTQKGIHHGSIVTSVPESRLGGARRWGQVPGGDAGGSRVGLGSRSLQCAVPAARWQRHHHNARGGGWGMTWGGSPSSYFAATLWGWGEGSWGWESRKLRELAGADYAP